MAGARAAARGGCPPGQIPEECLDKGLVFNDNMFAIKQVKEDRRFILKKLGNLLLLLLVVASFASASDFGPRRRGPGRGPIRSVAEPTAIVLLGAGLVSLGIYAKRKLGKKQ